MERVGIFQTSQRFGDGGSPIPVERYPKITPESQAELISIVGYDGFPPLQGTRMLVCSNRWYSDSFKLSSFAGRKLFFLRIFSSRGVNRT